VNSIVSRAWWADRMAFVGRSSARRYRRIWPGGILEVGGEPRAVSRNMAVEVPNDNVNEAKTLARNRKERSICLKPSIIIQ
jgi:hypothetical protein